jgi:hypothetical protein
MDAVQELTKISHHKSSRDQFRNRVYISSFHPRDRRDERGVRKLSYVAHYQLRNYKEHPCQGT